MRQNDSKLRIVVLGATGATGRHVVGQALSRGHGVTALVRCPGSFTPVDNLTELVWADLADRPTLTSALTGADTVIMTGDVVAVQGENVLRGERMVYNTKTGQGQMQGGAKGGKNRPRGVFYPKQDAAAAPKIAERKKRPAAR